MDELSISNIIQRILKTYFPKLKYSENKLEKITSILIRYKDQSPSSMEKIIIEYFRATILKGISTSKYLQEIYFIPYKRIYLKVNEVCKVNESDELFQIFIQSILDLSLSNQVLSFKKDLIALYQTRVKDALSLNKVGCNQEIPLFLKFVRTFHPKTTIQEFRVGLEELKKIDTNAYQVIFQKHGESLNENHELSHGQMFFYQSAIYKLTDILSKKVVLTYPNESNPKTSMKKTTISDDSSCSLFTKIRNLEGFSLVSKKEILTALEALKKYNIKYFQIIIKRHGESLLEWNTFHNSRDSLSYSYSIEKLKDILLNPQKPFVPKASVTNPLTLFEKIKGLIGDEDIRDEDILKALNILKYTHLNHYNIIIKRHGESLLEWNVFVNINDHSLYRYAIEKLRDIILNPQKSFVPKASVTNPLTLFEKIRAFTGDKKIRDEGIVKAIKTLKDFYPDYYDIVVKRHGESLLEWHAFFNKQENTCYSLAIRKIQFILLHPVEELDSDFKMILKKR